MKKKLLFLLASSLLSAPAFANDFVACTVHEVVTAGSNNVHVQLHCPNPIANLPACASAKVFVGFDGTTASGKYYFTMMSMALAADLKVTGTIDWAACAPYQQNVALVTAVRVHK